MAEMNNLYEIDLNIGELMAPCWSPGGRFLAVPSRRGSIGIFDIDDGQVVRTLEGHSAQVTSVGWDPRSDLMITSSVDRSLILWELTSERSVPLKLSGHDEFVHSVEWTDEGAFTVTCSVDHVRALDGACLLSGWTDEMEDGVNIHSRFTASSCSRHSTFLLALAAQDGSDLVLVSLLSADLLDRVKMAERIQALAWSPAEDLLAIGAGDGILVLRATQEGFVKPVRSLTRKTRGVNALSFSGDGSVLVSRDSQGLKIWEVEGSTEIARFDEKNPEESGSRVRRGVALHPERPLLATIASNGTAFRVADLSGLTPALAD